MINSWNALITKMMITVIIKDLILYGIKCRFCHTGDNQKYLYESDFVCAINSTLSMVGCRRPGILVNAHMEVCNCCAVV